MFYWQLLISGVDATAMLKEFITTLVVKYENQKPAIATIDISSPSFAEGIFVENQEIEIWMGLYRHELIQMFKGNIGKKPNGAATEILNYKIQATGGINGAQKTIIKNYEATNKTAIISEIILRMGYTPFIVLDDNSPIPAEDNVLQYNKTDIYFLNELSLRWGAVFWIDTVTKIAYFVEETKAHFYGNNFKLPNLADIENDYILSYRADNRINNIASIDWDCDPVAGPVEHGNETTSFINSDPNYQGDINVYGQEYFLKPEWREMIKKDPSLNAKILGMVSGADKAKNQAVLNKYFYVRGKDKERKDSRRPFGANGINANITLNDPDFYLRPPRSAKLYDGSLNQNMPTAHLPDFIFSSPKESTKFYINSVETGIRSGVGSTKIGISR